MIVEDLSNSIKKSHAIAKSIIVDTELKTLKRRIF